LFSNISPAGRKGQEYFIMLIIFWILTAQLQKKSDRKARKERKKKIDIHENNKSKK